MIRLALNEVDKTTREAIRNASDEMAARKGCRYDPERAERPILWWKKYLKLYEGSVWAGKPFIASDWQLECTRQMYGWIKHSERWSRLVGYEAWIRRFNQAVIFVPKKNKKSPTLAAHALFLLCGEGEQGQKVYLAARDGGQARDIVGKHAVEMVKQSSYLMEHCKIYNGTYHIHYHPTSSVLAPIASNNIESQKSKEGLNGSLLVDEIHVVDRPFMRRVSRCGIARMEPWQIEVSTAGNDPDSYGKSRYDYCRQVERGKVEDQRLFFATYEAPQDLDNAVLAENPEKWGMMANPAWDHTIDPDEYKADYAASSQNLADLADFKMYRLNIWQQSSNPWLDATAWNQCSGSVSYDDFRGRTCYVGLDLSRTKDMSAAVLVSRNDDGHVIIWPRFWLPEASALQLEQKVKIRQWEKDGHITICDGEVIDYDAIESELLGWHEDNIITVVYDRIYAEDMTRRLEDMAGVERLIFPQTIMNYAAPCSELERLIISKKIVHPSNVVLDWQIGHVNVKTDPNQNRRPVKPAKNDYRKIDGVVALLMGLSGVMQEPESSVYRSRGIACIEL